MADDKNAITDPAKIAAYVDGARYFYTDDEGAVRFDNPPVVARIPHGAKVRAWLPTEALRNVPGIEFDEQRAVRTNADGVEALVWLPVLDEDLIALHVEELARALRWRPRRPRK